MTNDNALANAIDAYVDSNHSTLEASDRGGSAYREMIGHMINTQLGMIPVDEQAYATKGEVR